MAKNGRPATQINQIKIKELMRLKPTLEDTAAIFECSTRTIERFVREQFKLSFVEFRDRHMVHTRHKLIRTAIEKAEGGDNQMLIFCLKNLCGWRDKQPGEEDKTLTHRADVQVKTDLSDRVEQLKSQK